MLENKKTFVPMKGQDWEQCKVKYSLRLIKYHAMKTRCGVKVWLHAFLTSTLDVSGQFHTPAALHLGEPIHGTIRQEAEWALKSRSEHCGAKLSLPETEHRFLDHLLTTPTELPGFTGAVYDITLPATS
jgi:hypothetical protein